jgi:hypothetical protein
MANLARCGKGQPFATGQSKDDYYATIQAPPLHPGCRCTVVGVLDIEVPKQWDQTEVARTEVAEAPNER